MMVAVTPIKAEHDLVALDVNEKTVSAALASEKLPDPTFEDVHLAYTRIVLNESGWESRPDMNGILEVLLRHSGGRNPKRNYQGTGYGINYRQFMLYAARVSTKTFPATDPWAYQAMVYKYGRTGETAREHHVKRQRSAAGNSYWTSELKLDCSEPKTWKEVYPDIPWSNFKKRCPELFRLTKEYLTGEHPNWCRTFDGEPATPKFWGCEQDVHRAEAEGWEELLCDDPDVDCSEEKRNDLNNNSCARNRWFRPSENEITQRILTSLKSATLFR